ncbi:AAA family ATPase [Candidatus Saccharibacteria bacterium]|nr:AAA family ATPase [Candidatus Saccharibacteria bacterium]
MSDYLFDYRDRRAAKARFYARVGKPLALISTVLAVFALLGGLMIFMVSGDKIGLFLVSFAFPLYSLRIWIKDDLKNPKTATGTVSGMLDPALLGLLPKNPSPKDIMKALLKTAGGKFFVARFGIPMVNLPELCGDDPEGSKEIWAAASDIYANLPERDSFISSTIVMATLILTQARILQILPALYLEEEDILNGCFWGAHLDHLVHEHAKPKMTGGVGRDWAFGYIRTLEQFGTNISTQYSASRSLNVKLETHKDAIDFIMKNLDSKGGGNVALIGKLGAGKTSVVEAFAERLMDPTAKIPPNLQYQQVFMLDASRLLSVAESAGGLDGLMNRILYEAQAAKNIILFFDNAELFFESGTGSVDITNLLLPVIENRALKMVFAMNEQRYLQISTANPALAAALNRLNIPPATEEETMMVLQDQIIMLEYQKNVTFIYQALREIYRLSSRYINDVAQPGAAVQLLQSSANMGGLITAQTVNEALEKTLGVKIGATKNAEEKEKLLNLEEQIHERMINQANAVKAVSAALRRARAGVRNENRPIGTFLFLGPTGVGKTELAKSLAAVYFGSEDNMVRIDLNEYVKADDVARLIEDGATNANSLTAQVRKNPFSVVLLDEIEKADDQVLTTLLQVLDEGILRDINNREVSFRDTIIIATSNAGANRIRELIDEGKNIEILQEEITNELIDQRVFAPEFLNRFDEIAVFRPLEKKELLQVLELIIASVNKNLSLQKVSVEVDDAAKAALVDAGYDPRLGARPMRRVVQKTIENIIAEKTLKNEIKPGETVQIGIAELDEVEGFSSGSSTKSSD